MQELKSVLVATDFSPASRTALRQAARLCDFNGAALHVLHAVPSENARELNQLAGGAVKDVESHVLAAADKRLAEEIEQSGVGVASARCVLGSATAGIMNGVSQVDAGLLVIGAHGTGGRRFGTVASRCMHKSPVSVLMVPQEQDGAFKRVVVGLDFSGLSKETLESAVRVARLDGAVIDAFNVYDVPWDTGWGSIQPKNAVQLETSLLEMLDSQYKALVPPEAEGLTSSFTAKSGFDYGKAIVEFAALKNADLVVVGMTGRSVLGYFLLGSTAEKTMRDTDCAVLAVK